MGAGGQGLQVLLLSSGIWDHLSFLYHLQGPAAHPFPNPEKTSVLLAEIIQEVLGEEKREMKDVDPSQQG